MTRIQLLQFQAESTTKESAEIIIDESVDISARLTPDWLQNASFAHVVPTPREVPANEESPVSSLSADSDVEVVAEVKKKKRKKKKEKKRKNSPEKLSTFDSKRVFVDPGKPFTMQGDLFGIERRGDTDNLRYQEMYKRHVAKYSLKRIPSFFDESVWNRYFAKKRKKTVLPRYFRMGKAEREAISRKFVPGTCVTISEPGTSGLAEVSNAGFVPLPAKCTTEVGTFFWNAKTRRYDVKSADDEGESPIPLNPAADFSQKVNCDPQNVELWLEFVRSVDEIQGYSGKKKTAKAVLDRKMAILEKAMSLNPKSLDLFLEKIDLGCQGFADRDTVLSWWKDAEFRFPHSQKMWRERIRFDRANRMGRFSFEQLLKSYDRCLSKIHQVLSGQLVTSDPEPESDLFVVEILLERVNILWEAGFEEKAVAGLQAMLEFNLFEPDSVKNSPLAEKRIFFEIYWAGNVPRFGEKGAVHWSEFFDRGGVDPIFTEIDDAEAEQVYGDIEQDILGADSSQVEKWLILERLRAQYFHFPWRGAEDSEPADPDRIVNFEDIAPYLYPVDLENHGIWILLKFAALFDCLTVDLSFCLFRDTAILSAFQSFDFFSNTRSFGDLACVQELILSSALPLPHDQRLLLTAMHLKLIARQVNREKDDVKTKLKMFKERVRSILENDANRTSCVPFCIFAECIYDLGGIAEFEKRCFATLKSIDSKLPDLSDLERGAILRMIVLLAESYRTTGKLGDLEGFLVMFLRLFPLDKIASAASESHSPSADDFRSMCSGFIRQVVSKCQELNIVSCWMGFCFKDAAKVCLMACDQIYPEILQSIFDDMADFNRTLRSRLVGNPRKLADKEFADVAAFYLEPAAPKLSNKQVKSIYVDLLTEAPVSWSGLVGFSDLHLAGYLFTDLRSVLNLLMNSDKNGLVALALFRAELKRFLKLSENDNSKFTFHGGFSDVVERLMEFCGGLVEFWLFYIDFLATYAPEKLAQDVPRILMNIPWSKRVIMKLIEKDPSQFVAHLDHLTVFELRTRLPIEELELLQENFGKTDVS